jgi:MFS family permease
LQSRRLREERKQTMIAQRPEMRELRAGTWRSLALIVVSLAIFLDALDVSIVTIALPHIQVGLQMTTTELQWVPGIYVLAYAGLQLLGGRAADLLGRRRIFLLGVMLFGLASLTAGLAHSGWLLILARGGQGIGAALTFPSAVSILTTNFAEGSERNKAVGVFSAMGAAGFTAYEVLYQVCSAFSCSRGFPTRTLLSDSWRMARILHYVVSTNSLQTYLPDPVA